ASVIAPRSKAASMRVPASMAGRSRSAASMMGKAGTAAEEGAAAQRAAAGRVDRISGAFGRERDGGGCRALSRPAASRPPEAISPSPPWFRAGIAGRDPALLEPDKKARHRRAIQGFLKLPGRQ